MPAQALAVIAQHEATGRRVTGATLARELGVSDSYGRRLLRLHAEGKFGAANGSSAEVAAT